MLTKKEELIFKHFEAELQSFKDWVIKLNSEINKALLRMDKLKKNLDGK